MYYKLENSSVEIKLVSGGYIEIYADDVVYQTIPAHTPLRKALLQIQTAWKNGFRTKFKSYLLGDRGDIACINLNKKELYRRDYL